MLEQGNSFGRCCAIPKPQIEDEIRGCWLIVVDLLVDALNSFANGEVNPASMHRMELRVESCLRSLGGGILEQLLSLLEPEDVEKMPGVVAYRGRKYRRLPAKQPREKIVTRFGCVSLRSARYRRGRAGKVCG